MAFQKVSCATPVPYLIDEEGIIAYDVAVGADAILALLNQGVRATGPANRNYNLAAAS